MTYKEADEYIDDFLSHTYDGCPNEKLAMACITYQETIRELTDSLKELRDRMTYFFMRVDGTFDPPYVTEMYRIAKNGLKKIGKVNG